MTPQLSWLPAEPRFDARLAALKQQAGDANAWREMESLARTQLDFLQTGRLDRVLSRLLKQAPTPEHLQPVRVALLASSTTPHLLPSIRIAALRRGLLLDAHHLADLAQTGPAAALDRITTCWRLCREHFSASVIHQTALPILEPIAGSNEHRFASSTTTLLQQLNEVLPAAASEHGAALLNAAGLAATFSLDALHDPALWHLAKQEVHPSAAPVYADYLVRIVAALRGRSAKCLVLDLDNTLWGGILGDAGIDKIQLGKGHAVGEAHLEFQRYCLALKSRGIALAVCSRNDEAMARTAFRDHPAMLLREQDIACFVANWQDKAANVRHIARTLNLGLDALVFIDDNPAERALIRQELPEVAVLELPPDPAGFIRCLARSGCFEAVCCTVDDEQRAERYRANAVREATRETATDLHSYLSGLEMTARVKPFDEAGLPRIAQLIHKTNQFNLTTPRPSEAQVRLWMEDPCMRTWQVRLTDRFGDNGIVALMAARICGDEATLTLLLMSCRVLGRRLEEELLNLFAAAARDAGAARLTGIYRPTPRNGMVRDLFPRFGFPPLTDAGDGGFTSTLATADFEHRVTEIAVVSQEAAP